MRVYLPSTTSGLRTLISSGQLGPAPLTAFAVTPGLREWYQDDDIEALEYAAMSEAARASLRLIEADPKAAARRVVVALDASDVDVQVRDDLDRGVVQLTAIMPISAVASAHLDDSDAEETVNVAAGMIDAADVGDADAEALVDDAAGFELGWHAVQEISGWLDSLS